MESTDFRHMFECVEMVTIILTQKTMMTDAMFAVLRKRREHKIYQNNSQNGTILMPTQKFPSVVMNDVQKNIPY